MTRMLPLAVAIFCARLIHGQTVPTFIPDARPPPVQEVNYVENILDDLLNGRKPDLLNSRQSNETDPNAVQPWSFVNQSTYWDMHDLKAEGSVTDMSEAQTWLDGYLAEAGSILHMATDAGWRYFTNITDDNRHVLVDSEKVLSTFLTASAKQAKQFDLASFSSNHTLQRLLHMLGVEGMNALTLEEEAKLSEAKDGLTTEFLNAAVCQQGRRPPCTIRYHDLNAVAALDRSANVQRYVWQQWREIIGPRSRTFYERTLDVNNHGAHMNGYSDAGALWRSPYEMAAPSLAHGPTFDMEATLESLWTQMQPLYTQLHAYVRKELARRFSTTEEPLLMKDTTIPAELLGSVSGNDWSFLYDETMPFPDLEATAPSAESVPWQQPSVSSREADVTAQLATMNMTARQLFQQAEIFFTSMGFEALPQSFWDESIFKQVYPRDMLCYPWTAFDFKSGDDFRMKACANDVTGADLNQAHRLMAQTYYQYTYRHQPVPFREPANPSLSVGIADAIAMTAANSVYLESVVGVRQTAPTNEETVNELYRSALRDVAGLPFSMVVDLWRWAVHDGRVPAGEWNSAWWMLRERLQGVRAPFARSEQHFDAASSPLITQQDFPATRTFIDYVLKYQIEDALCQTAGATSVRDCNLYASKAVGERLRRAMTLGSSVAWPEVLRELTGSDRLDAAPLLRHYEPLTRWLAEHNADEAEYIGWDGTGTPFDTSLYRDESGDYGNGLGGSGLPFGPSTTVGAGEQCHAPNTLCNGTSVCNGFECVCDFPLIAVSGECVEDTQENREQIIDADVGGGFRVNIIRENALTTAPTTKSPRSNRTGNGVERIASSLVLLAAILFFLLR